MNDFIGWKFLASFGIGIALISHTARAEDPLLGEIRVIKCVGCEPGKVTLVIHDPIDVRDFDVTIQDADYSKIVTPLPGKRVFDRGDGCFYWDDAPKVAKTDAVKPGAKDAVKPAGKETLKKTSAGKPGKKDVDAPDSDAAAAKGNASNASDAPEAEIKPSRCIPYAKVALPKATKQD